MVRPLINVQSETELAALLDAQTAIGGEKELCAALYGYAVVLTLVENSMSAYVMVCSETSAGYYIAETDSVEVVTPLVDLPCSTGIVDEGTIDGALQGLVRAVANYGGYDFANFNIYEREDYSTLSVTCKYGT